MDLGGSRRRRRFLVDDCAVEVRAANLTSILSKAEFYPVVDLSEEGLQMVAFGPIKVRQRLHLDLKVGNQFGFLKSQGEVRWVVQIPDEEAYRVGVAFVKLSDREVAKLEELRKKYGPRQQEILVQGMERLKVPQAVARKLQVILMESCRRLAHADAREGSEAGAGAAAGPWLDVPARKSPVRDTEKIELDPGLRPAQPSEGAEPAPDEAESAAEPSAQAESPAADDLDANAPALVRRHLPVMPLFLLGSGHTIRIDDDGRPVSRPATKISLPGFSAGHFACRLTDNSMTAKGGAGFRIGDLIVFAMDKTAAGGALVFVATDEVSCFRQVLDQHEGTVTFRPLNPNLPDMHLDADDIKALWPAALYARIL